MTSPMPPLRPVRNGVPASRLQLPPGPWQTVLQALCAHFSTIPATHWQQRFEQGRVLDARGEPLPADHPYRVGMTVQYFRDVADEPVIPYAERIIHRDADLVVACKPHFLPVAPTGAFVRQTLLARLVERLDNPHLVPLHRIDRDTAGLVLFSANPRTRGIYQALFRERRIRKQYLAVAPPLPDLTFPHIHRSQLVAGEPFFRMTEADGAPNTETVIDVAARGRDVWTYRLEPVTGRKHQLRVHMAALGAPILHDRSYPDLQPACADDPLRPLQLLAQSLAFTDPVDGTPRRYVSARALLADSACAGYMGNADGT